MSYISKGPSVLSQWEANAKEMIDGTMSSGVTDSAYHRILTLIELIRKKDEALAPSAIILDLFYRLTNNLSALEYSTKLSEALALTEKLK